MVQHEGQVSWADARTDVPLEPPGEEEASRGVHPPRELLHRLLARWTVEQGLIPLGLEPACHLERLHGADGEGARGDVRHVHEAAKEAVIQLNLTNGQIKSTQYINTWQAFSCSYQGIKK